MKSIRLNTGASLPLLGLGTWAMDDTAAARTVKEALTIGYRLIDTATMYGNEAGVGAGIRESGIDRKEVVVTTKLWPSDFGDPLRAFNASLKRLGLEYVDLYLIHWPKGRTPHHVWQALEKIYDDKRARAIGVSNFEVADMEELFTYARVRPAVNQVKFSVFDFRRDLLDYCEAQHVALEAYSPLTRGTSLHDPTLQEIAAHYGKTPAQIMLRWCIEHGVAAIPKSSNPERLRENFDLFSFEIAAEHMTELDELSG
jgi:diketogulonate reductase-like aldo/keto reductase